MCDVIYIYIYMSCVHACVCVCVYDGDADTVRQFLTGRCTLDISIGFPEHARKPPRLLPFLCIFFLILLLLL